MSSSIFNFDALTRYARLPLRERLWHLTVLATLTATFVAARVATTRVATRARVNFITEARRALSAETRVLFVGNSHFYSGIRPDAFPFKAMTISGSGFNYQILEAVLLKHLDRMTGLRVAVVAFDTNPLLNTAAGGLGQSAQLTDWGLSPSEVPRGPGASSPGVISGLRSFIHSTDRLSPDLVLTALGLRASRAVAGHLPSDERYAVPPKGISVRLDHHARVFKEAEFEANCASLGRIVRALDAKGIRVVLLRTPFHRSYAAYRPARWEEFCGKAWARIRDDPGLGGRVAYIDMIQDPRFLDGDFRDDDHLNSAGAAKLCASLGQPIARLMDEAEPPTQIAGTPNAKPDEGPVPDPGVLKK